MEKMCLESDVAATREHVYFKVRTEQIKMTGQSGQQGGEGKSQFFIIIYNFVWQPPISLSLGILCASLSGLVWPKGA